jgi:hypothetical protein
MVWIVDGHNAIFALPSLSRLQREGDRSGARQQLEALLESFASRLTGTVLIVYDGNAMPRNPDAVTGPHLQTLFSQPPEEADDRIVFLAEQALKKGRAVTVVTNDRRSLAPRLPKEVRVLGVDEFRERHLVPPPAAEMDKAPPGDFSDIERHFLEREDEIQEKARRSARQLQRQGERCWVARNRPPPRADEPGEERWVRPGALSDDRRPSVGAGASSADGGKQKGVDEGEWRKRLEEKKSKGRCKQRRRLEQMRRARTGGRSSRPKKGCDGR